MGQRTEFTFEVEETITLIQCGKLVAEFCPKCGEITDLVSPEIIALAIGVSEREIFRLIEKGQIHYIEDRLIYACARCIQLPTTHVARATFETDQD